MIYINTDTYIHLLERGVYKLMVVVLTGLAILPQFIKQLLAGLETYPELNFAFIYIESKILN